MWFEIIPTVAIILGAMSVPHLSAFVLNYLVVGNPYRRGLDEGEHRMQYLRGRRLTGNPYIVAGLENIPDEECEDEENDGTAQGPKPYKHEDENEDDECED